VYVYVNVFLGLAKLTKKIGIAKQQTAELLWLVGRTRKKQERKWGVGDKCIIFVRR
jgi:hypothetical protein